MKYCKKKTTLSWSQFKIRLVSADSSTFRWSDAHYVKSNWNPCYFLGKTLRKSKEPFLSQFYRLQECLNRRKKEKRLALLSKANHVNEKTLLVFPFVVLDSGQLGWNTTSSSYIRQMEHIKAAHINELMANNIQIERHLKKT